MLYAKNLYNIVHQYFNTKSKIKIKFGFISEADYYEAIASLVVFKVVCEFGPEYLTIEMECMYF